MKLIFCFLSLLFFMGQCRKEASVEPVPANPKDTLIPVKYGLTALKDGLQWEASATATYYQSGIGKHLRLVFLRKINNDITERLHIEDIASSAGTYPIERVTKASQIKNFIPNSFFSIYLDEEQPVGHFFPDTTRRDHFIQIIQFDSVAQTVRGRFQVFMGIVAFDPLWTNHPDSVLFTKGEFFVKIQQ